MNYLKHLLGIAVLAAGLLTVSDARACKDCPFPKPIGANQWLMPSGNVVVSIYQAPLRGGSHLVAVELHHARTGELIAAGTAKRKESQYTLHLTLRDYDGRRIRAKIHWVHFERAVIQVKFECLDDYRCLLFKD